MTTLQRIIQAARSPSTYVLVAVMAVLFAVSVSFHMPFFPLSWVMHFVFVAALTVLVYGRLLEGRHPRLYFAWLLALMAAWETYEWIFDSKLGGSVPLTLFDTAMDTLSGLFAAGVVVKRWSVVKRSRLPVHAVTSRADHVTTSR